MERRAARARCGGEGVKRGGPAPLSRGSCGGRGAGAGGGGGVPGRRTKVGFPRGGVPVHRRVLPLSRQPALRRGAVDRHKPPRGAGEWGKKKKLNIYISIIGPPSPSPRLNPFPPPGG